MSLKSLMSTGINEFDVWLGGGISPYMMIVIGGGPGAGKTILAQQIMFNRIKEDQDSKALYLSTLSEPLPTVIRHMQKFDFFDEEIFADRVIYRDLGDSIKKGDFDGLIHEIRQMIEEVRPSMLVIDSFKAVNDIANSIGLFRQFCFDLTVMLSTMRVTTLLVGEYARDAMVDLTEFAVADGIIQLEHGVVGGEPHRLLQVLKMRGQNPKSGKALFSISGRGIKVFDLESHIANLGESRLPLYHNLVTRIPGLDPLLGGGFSQGTAVLVSGTSGTGKTTLCLQLLIKAAEAGEQCVFFSVEQSPHGLQEQAESFGFDIQSVLDSGLLQIVYTPLSEIRVESVLEGMARKIKEFSPSYFVLDSSSVLLNQTDSSAFQRRKIWEVGQMAKVAGSVVLFTSDIPSGEPSRSSRFGVEETMADCVIRLSMDLALGCNQRFVEVLKHRSHRIIQGKWYMEMEAGGIDIFHVENDLQSCGEIPDSISFEPVKEFVKGRLDYGSSWLCLGEPGVGKSSVAAQFALEGLNRGESAIVVTVDGPAKQTRDMLVRQGKDVDGWEREGRLVLLDVFSQTSAEGRNWQTILMNIQRHLNRMPPPIRLVLDSLTPMQTVFREQFFELVLQKNRLLRHPGVALFDTTTNPGLNEDMISLTNFYDVVLSLFTPNWGDMQQGGNEGMRAMAMTKARGVKVDMRPRPYVISEQEGILIKG